MKYTDDELMNIGCGCVTAVFGLLWFLLLVGTVVGVWRWAI